MSIRLRFPSLPAVLLSALLCAVLPAWPEEVRVGRAVVSITPPVGAAMGSSYGLRISQGVHDDLHAKVIVLEKDGERAALVACDLISLQPPLVKEVRHAVERRAGLRPDQVIVSATHTHSGPQMHPLFLAQVGGAAQALGERYREELPDKIAEAVRQAVEDLRPARAWVGAGHEEAVSFNRRFLMRDGSVRMNPGAGNPEIVRAVGGIDPEVSVIYFDTPDGEPLATHVNFALHVAVAGGNRFSADYPHFLAALLSKIKGGQMLTLFTMGAAGDLNHLDVTNRDQLRGLPEAKRIGRVLAGGVLKTFAGLAAAPAGSLQSRTVQVELPARETDPADFEKARQIFSRYGKDDGLPFHDVVWAWRVLDIANLRGQPWQADVQVITLGDQIAWVGLPGEIFVELGLAIKKASPFPHTIVSGMSASGTISYVPTRKAFLEGSYEVLSARFAPGGGERLADAAIETLFDLYPGGRPSNRP